MRYSFISAAIVALVSSVVAQTTGFDAITSPTQDQNIPAGSSFDIIWQPGTVDSTVTITLLQGATPGTLQAGAVIASSIDNQLGKYTWTVPSSSSFATYGFEIVLDSTAKDATPTLQYSFPFHITGATSSSATGTGSASATGTGSSTTVRLSTGPSYTSTSSPAVVTGTSNTSKVPSPTEKVVSNSSTASTTLAPVSSSSSGSGSNFTLSTLKISTTKTGSGSETTSTGSSSASSTASASTNAAGSNIATGGFAMVGGIIIALAL